MLASAVCACPPRPQPPKRPSCWASAQAWSMSSCGLWPASASCTNDFLNAGSTTSSSTGRTTHGYIVRIQ